MRIGDIIGTREELKRILYQTPTFDSLYIEQKNLFLK